MNREEAQGWLEMATLLPEEEHSAEMREALELAARDPELRAWFEERRAFDREVADSLAGIRPPDGLRARLVQSLEQERSRRHRAAPIRWLAFAALFAVLGTASILMLRRGVISDWKSEALAAVERVDDGRLPLDQWSGDVATLQRWLAASSSPTVADLPQGMSALAALGCKRVMIGGKPASIICFALPGSNDEAHLVVLQSDDARKSAPVFETRGDWRCVTWNENGRILMLASRAPEESLRRFVAAARNEAPSFAHAIIACCTLGSPSTPVRRWSSPW